MKVFIVIVSLIFSQFATANEWINFEWSQDYIGGKIYDKAAIMIRVNEHKLLQLDTGSTKSYLYAPEFNFTGQKDVSFQLTGNNKLLHSYRVHKTAKSDEKSVGTLGADYFKDSILVIDFPNQKLIKLKSLNPKIIPVNKITWLEAEVTDYLHISTSITVGDIKFDPVLFDTGSSIFSLVLNKKQWKTVVSKKDVLSPPLKMEVPAWGNMITVYGASSIEPICMGSICKKSDVYYMDDPRMDLSKQGLAGLVGNAILRDEYTLILDYKNKRIGTVKK